MTLIPLIVGDWVQATEDITEENFCGVSLHLHARKGGVGHVMEINGDGAATITWERTGTTTVAHRSEFKRLCNTAGVGVIGNLSDEAKQ